MPRRRFQPIRRFDGTAVRIAGDNAFRVVGATRCQLCRVTCRPGTLMRRRGDGYVHAEAGACRAQLEQLRG